DAGGSEVHRGRRAEAAGADAQDASGLQLALLVHADLRQDQVPAVSLDFLRREVRQILHALLPGLDLGDHRSTFAGSAFGDTAPPATDGTMLSESPGLTGVCSRCRERMFSSFRYTLREF